MIGVLLLALQATAPATPAEPQARPPASSVQGAPGHALAEDAQAAPHPDVPAPPPVEPWDRSFAAGLAEIRHGAETGEQSAAREVAARLVAPNALARWTEELAQQGGWRARAGELVQQAGDTLDLLGPPPPVRAEAHYALGVALDGFARAAEDDAERVRLRGDATQAFERARLLAGPGVLREDATYDQGCIALAEGEEERAKIPEISGQPPAAPGGPAGPAGPGAGPGAGQGQQPPDPLELARAAYLRARERFIQRIRLAWNDADTQKNVELIQRRLRELDEIERKRQEAQQKQQDQQKQDQQQQDQKQDQQDQKSKPDPKQPDQPDQPKPGEDKKPDEKPDQPKPDEQKPEDQKQDEPKQDEQKKPGEEQQAQPMSKEEMLQLLERLQKIDDVQKELQERLKRMRRVDVPKDW